MLGFKLWHVLSVGLFSGALFVMVALQALLESAPDDQARKALASFMNRAARLVVMPLTHLAFVSGLAYFVWGIELFRRTPHVHVMLTLGLFAVGLAEMWRGRVRRLAEGLDQGRSFDDLRGLVARGRLFALGAVALVFAAYVVAVLRVPSSG